MGDPSDAAGETLFVVMPERAPAARPRVRPPAEEPRRKLRVTIPATLADELKQAVSVIPGCCLDELVGEALEKILAERSAGTRQAPRPSRRGRIYDSSILVILP